MSSHAHNHCAGVGGAIYVTKYAVLTLHGANNFTNNSAGTYGGAIYTILCLVSLEPPNSVATLLSMVVVHIYAERRTSLAFTGTSEFMGKSAEFCGGAIVIATNSVLTFNGINNFIKNSAEGSGGEIRAFMLHLTLMV